MPASARAFSRAKQRPGSSLSSGMKTRCTPCNHLPKSGVQFPGFLLFGFDAPSELVVAISPSAASVSASFSPSGAWTSSVRDCASAASISGKR